ncbi:MAG: hypothetical protein IKM50_02620, partial [Tidjanibacter sp.]|nr:hypothetical protein [Tidjanibacter sp.]
MSKADIVADKEQKQTSRAEQKAEHKEQLTERKAARRAKRAERKAARKARRAERRARRRERRAYWKEWRQRDYQASREKALATNGQGVIMLTSIKVPPYIYSTRSQLLIISFTTIFALLFINIYTPFNSYTWAPMNDTLYFVSSTIVVGGGMVLVILSRVFMNLFARKRGIYYWLYIAWILCEIGLMAIGFTICAVAMRMQSDFMDALGLSFKNTALIYCIPYIISTIYLSWRENLRRLQAMERAPIGTTDAQTTIPHNAQHAEPEATPEVTHTTLPHAQPAMLHFYDERGELRLSVDSESLIYIEAADNYTCLHYLNKGALRKTMIRN